MPIQQALQLAYALHEKRACKLDLNRGSQQILGQGHVLRLLKAERAAVLAGAAAALVLDEQAEPQSRFVSDALQFIFGRSPRRRVVSFLG